MQYVGMVKVELLVTYSKAVLVREMVVALGFPLQADAEIPIYISGRLQNCL